METQAKPGLGTKIQALASYFFKPKDTGVHNWEQEHSLSKDLTKCGGEEGGLKAQHLQERAESRNRAHLDLFAAVLDIRRLGTEGERIPGFNGVAVLTASRLQL